jgi:hypothetical protein
LQITMHIPLRHAATPFAADGHRLPHDPQLFTSVLKLEFAQQLPLQAV